METPTFDFDAEPASAAEWAEFTAYHSANPQVYAKMRQYALEAKAAGRTHFGINMIHERVRWYTNVEAVGDLWKLNNNYRPFYARLLMANEPELAGLFELRTAKADAA